MDVDRMIALFEQFKNENFFDKPDLSNSNTNRRELAALIHIDNITPLTNCITVARDDAMYLNVDLNRFASKVSEEDIYFLVTCGVIIEKNSLCILF